MNGWAKIQFSIAAATTAAFAAVGLAGFGVAADPARFPVHTQLGLVVTLALTFAQSWMALFAVVSARGLRPLLGDRPAEWRAIARVRRRVGIAAGLAAAAALVHFAVAGRLFASHAAGWIHRTTALVALAAQLVALVVEARELARHRRVLEEVADAPRAADHVLDSARS